jgi:hypothetical protein
MRCPRCTGPMRADPAGHICRICGGLVLQDVSAPAAPLQDSRSVRRAVAEMYDRIAEYLRAGVRWTVIWKQVQAAGVSCRLSTLRREWNEERRRREEKEA